MAGASLFLQAVQDIRVGGRQGNAQYQYTLQADNLADLYEWAPKLTDALKHAPELTDVNSDQQQGGLETDLVIDRATATRLGITTSQIDNTLYDAFGQRQVSTIYNPLEPVPRGHGGGAGVLAEPGHAAGHLRQHRGWCGGRRPGDQCGRRHGQPRLHGASALQCGGRAERPARPQPSPHDAARNQAPIR